ncbi:Flagellar biosynthesis protein, FliO [Planctomycetes bacterium CA13]|uniref:Flagellar biosynthesis protein, FliO n=1 Tax=Novipirellula herctigrandis TaxID=2527986 RepID=A0A5C5Z9V1_9BACT|nr:Flagellar biosynthesis protein, FliO [Planctomycetes bacterium CA13]
MLSRHHLTINAAIYTAMLAFAMVNSNANAQSAHPSALAPSALAPSAYPAPSKEDSSQDTMPRVVTVTRGFPSLSNRTTIEPDASTPPETVDNGFASPTVTVCSSLAVVLGLFAGFVWLTRRFGVNSSSQRGLSNEVFETLGSTSIDARTKVTLLRCGSRILITAQTATGIHPLSEISDAEEVRSLLAACNCQSKNAFASTLQSLEKEPVQKGFVAAEAAPANAARSRGRLFASA